MPPLRRVQAETNEDRGRPLGRDHHPDPIVGQMLGAYDAMLRLCEQPIDERRARSLLAAADRDEERYRQIAHARSEMSEEAERGWIGPVGVVDGDQESARDRRQVHGQPIEPADERLCVVGRGSVRVEHGGGQSRMTCQQGRALIGRGGGETRPEQLGSDPERDVALELDAARGKDAEAALCRLGARGGQQARLPDAGRALGNDDISAAVHGVCHCARQSGDLMVAFDQRLDPADGHRVACYGAQTRRAQRIRRAQISGCWAEKISRRGRREARSMSATIAAWLPDTLSASRSSSIRTPTRSAAGSAPAAVRMSASAGGWR